MRRAGWFTLGLCVWTLGWMAQVTVDLADAVTPFAVLMMVGAVSMAGITAKQLFTGEYGIDDPRPFFTYLMVFGGVLMFAGGVLRLLNFF